MGYRDLRAPDGVQGQCPDGGPGEESPEALGYSRDYGLCKDAFNPNGFGLVVNRQNLQHILNSSTWTELQPSRVEDK